MPRTTELGVLVECKPAVAVRRLETLYARHGGDRRAVAVELGVTASTVGRWLRRLLELGYTPVGRRPRGWPRGRPRPKGRAQAAGPVVAP